MIALEPLANPGVDYDVAVRAQASAGQSAQMVVASDDMVEPNAVLS